MAVNLLQEHQHADGEHNVSQLMGDQALETAMGLDRMAGIGKNQTSQKSNGDEKSAMKYSAEQNKKCKIEEILKHRRASMAKCRQGIHGTALTLQPARVAINTFFPDGTHVGQMCFMLAVIFRIRLAGNRDIHYKKLHNRSFPTRIATIHYPRLEQNMADRKQQDLQTEKVVWNLHHLYTGTDDLTIDKDIEALQKEAATVNAQFAGNLAELSPRELRKLMIRLEDIATGIGKLSTYAYLNFATQTQEATAAAFLQKIREAGSRIGREIVFFELEWNEIDEKTADALLDSTDLNHYRHYLQNIRRYADHLLSKAEETLLIEIAPVGRGSWNNLFDKLLGFMKFGDSGRTEEEVLSDLYDPDREVRRQAAAELTAGLSTQLHILTHIFNTILADKMIEDRLRAYPSWVSSMNLHNELRDETVDVLIEAVTGRYDIPQRYYELKRKLLELPELTDYDRYAPLPHLSDKIIPWPECRKMVLEAFADFSPQMAEIADMFFEKEWIHAPVQEGKRGGAFAHPCVPEVHPYIMVNYTGNLRDVSTVAHELGHGVHQYLAAEQGYFNSSTTLVLAETASVFGELLVFNHQLDALSAPEEKRAFICQKLESIFATVFRQVAMNRFEDLIHRGRREQGELATEDFSRYWLQTQTAMFGDSVSLSEEYGIWWSYIPHFLGSPGYVYSYAFGELLVLSLYRMYQQDRQTFVANYLDLLKSGGSRSPYESLQPFGIDLDDPEFWQGGLTMIDDLLRKVE